MGIFEKRYGDRVDKYGVVEGVILIGEEVVYWGSREKLMLIG